MNLKTPEKSGVFLLHFLKCYLLRNTKHYKLWFLFTRNFMDIKTWNELSPHYKEKWKWLTDDLPDFVGKIEEYETIEELLKE